MVGGILGDDKKYNYDGGVIGEKIITQKIYSNQSSHKTISWYIQDNHTIVRHHTNINQSQQKKSEKTKKSDTKNPNIFNTPPKYTKIFPKKKLSFRRKIAIVKPCISVYILQTRYRLPYCNFQSIDMLNITPNLLNIYQKSATKRVKNATKGVIYSTQKMV